MFKRFKKLKKCIKNNGGFTIAELLVTMALFSLVAVGVMVMMSAGGNMFNRTNTQINLQYKSQNSMSQFQQYFMSCSTGICRQENGIIYFSDSENVYAFKFDENQNKIFFGQAPIGTASVELSAENIADPFASGVSSFTADVSASSDTVASSVKITLTFEEAGKSYTASQVFAFRGKPVYIGSGSLQELVETLTGS